MFNKKKLQKEVQGMDSREAVKLVERAWNKDKKKIKKTDFQSIFKGLLPKKR